MSNDKHLEILTEGVPAWNAWREAHPEAVPDLSSAHLPKASLVKVNFKHASLRNASFMEADLMWADLRGADLTSADLRAADLSGADLSGVALGGARLAWASFRGATLPGLDFRAVHLTQPGGGKFMNSADFSEADLRGANFSDAYLEGLKFARADLTDADLSDATLSGSDFTRATLIRARLVRAVLNGALLLETNLEGADLSGSRIYGTSVWGARLTGAVQSGLIITPWKDSVIEVDNLEVAQFIYLLLNNEKLRAVIDSITSKVVLLLGRFSETRKVVLDAMREELRRRNFTPVVFDFEKPSSKDLTGTVETLARLARFVVVDISDARSVPQELAAIVPHLRTTPVLPVRLEGSRSYTLFDDLHAYPWVLKTHEYADTRSLITGLSEIVAPADRMADEFRKTRQLT
jgi:uncharacterized protein YjbI with pentapeptide repeats